MCFGARCDLQVLRWTACLAHHDALQVQCAYLRDVPSDECIAQAKAAILSVSLLIGTAQMEPTLPNSADSSEDDQDDGNNHQQQGRHAQMQPVPCGRAGHSIQAGSRRSILSEVHEGRIGGALAVNIERQAEGVTEPGEHQSLLALHPPKPSHPQSARPRRCATLILLLMAGKGLDLALSINPKHQECQQPDCWFLCVCMLAC
jgi:hypothetical protein